MPTVDFTTAANRKEFIRPFGDSTLDGYLRDVAAWHGHIRFIGLPVLKDTGRLVPLPRLFVEPRLSTTPLSPEQLDDEEAEGQTVSLLEALLEHPRLVLLGDPGSGKSTIISWLCDTFADFGGSELSVRLGQLVPIPLILRELTPGDVTDWASLIRAFLRRPVAQKLARAPEKLDQVLTVGQAVILIDGLDEVSVASREGIRAAVWDGWRQYPACRWLMTSRIVGYDRCQFDRSSVSDLSSVSKLEEAVQANMIDEGALSSNCVGSTESSSQSTQLCSRLYVAPFTLAQIQEFSINWHRIRAANDREAEENAADLLSAVLADPGTKTLARVPNLLTLMALIHRQHATLPNGRALLFAKITEAYLESIDEARKLRPLVESSRAEKERWLGDVAFQMQLRRDSESSEFGTAPGEMRVPESWLLSELASLLAARRKVSLEKATKEARILLGVIAERSGLLLPRGSGEEGEMWAFAHLSFQEYFAAQRIRRAVCSPGWAESSGDAAPERLVDYAGRSVWREIFILLFESLAVHETEGVSWPDYLAGKLFETLPDSAEPVLEHFTDRPSQGLQRLGIPLFHNPHSGLNLEMRSTLCRKLWTSYFSGFSIADNGELQAFGLIDGLEDLFQPSEYRDLSIETFQKTTKLAQPKVILVFNLDKELYDIVFSLRSLHAFYFFPSVLSQTEVDQIGQMRDLRLLSVTLNPELELRPLAKLTKLQRLYLKGRLDRKKLLNFVQQLDAPLTAISLPETSEKVVTACLQKFPRLKSVSLMNPTSEQVTVLQAGSNIQTLSLTGLSAPVDLSFVTSLPHLGDLHLMRPKTGELDLHPLIGKKGLKVTFEHRREWLAESDPLPSDPWNSLPSDILS